MIDLISRLFDSIARPTFVQVLIASSVIGGVTGIVHGIVRERGTGSKVAQVEVPSLAEVWEETVHETTAEVHRITSSSRWQQQMFWVPIVGVFVGGCIGAVLIWKERY